MRARSTMSERENETPSLHGAMRIRDFCERYKVGRTKANEEIKEGRLEAKKFGRRTLIGKEAAEEWWRSLPTVKAMPSEPTLKARNPSADAAGGGSAECVSAAQATSVVKTRKCSSLASSAPSVTAAQSAETSLFKRP
jgi:excisionase family DNA binding protein